MYFSTSPKWLYEDLPAYIAAIVGQSHLPLDYLLRHDDEPFDYGVHKVGQVSFEELAKEAIPLWGHDYKSENKGFYQLLLGLVKDTSAMNIIPTGRRAQQDGREIYRSIIGNNKQEHGEHCLISMVDDQLCRLQYQGVKVMPFVDFLKKLKDVYKLRHQGNDPVSNRRKLIDFVKKTSYYQDVEFKQVVHEVKLQQFQNPES